VATAFQAVLCGSKDGKLHICSLKSGLPIRVIDTNGAKAKKIIVTPAWGFIVACVRRVTRMGTTVAIMVWTINGELVGESEIQAEVTEWTTWTSETGFDFVAMVDETNVVYAFEAREAARPTVLRVIQGKVMGLHCLSAEKTLVVVFGDGTIEFLPWQSGR
jgi:hypothetical protein